MKPWVRGKNIFLREVAPEDAEFILSLRTDTAKNRYLSTTTSDVQAQRDYINRYLDKADEHYFIICRNDQSSIGTVRIYDVQGDSFCWGSWILVSDAPKSAAIESALLVYDYAFYALHYKSAHFDVRKNNTRVVEFHRRFGADITSETDLDFYFNYEMATYLEVRKKYGKYIP